MKASDVQRAADLRKALKVFPSLRRELKRKKERGYDKRVLKLQVEDICASGSTGERGAEIDLVAAPFVVDVVEMILRNELKGLGANVARRKSRR